MSMQYDKSVDALYITLKKGKFSKTKEENGYLVDYDKQGYLLGVEILHYSKKAPVLGKMAIGKAAKSVTG
jgi:uncharacterized protein YuzE